MSTDPNRRSTSNANVRGNSTARRRRREWLVETFAADVVWATREGYSGTPVIRLTDADGLRKLATAGWTIVKVCRCYRCGTLLSADDVSPDRIIPGCEGGTYRRNNIRPSCLDCQTKTGSALGHQRKQAQKGARK